MSALAPTERSATETFFTVIVYAAANEIRKRVFSPRRGAVERVPPLHFAVSVGAESFVLRCGPGRSAWLTPFS